LARLIGGAVESRRIGMRRRTAFFGAAAIGAIACLFTLVFNKGEDVTTPAALFAAWAVIMLVLALRQPH
jgi:uncharacterized membrane protein